MLRDFSILLVEDSSMEVMKVRRAMDSLNLAPEITEARNGKEALEALQDPNNLPSLILLDLNMPKMNGIEFLTTLKENKSSINVPIIILTSSNCENDITTCYRLGVSGYITKPTKYTDYLKKMKELFTYCDSMEFTKVS